MTSIRSVEVFPAAAGVFFVRQKRRSYDFMTLISFVEVFPAAAGAFFSAKRRSWDLMILHPPR